MVGISIYPSWTVPILLSDRQREQLMQSSASVTAFYDHTHRADLARLEYQPLFSGGAPIVSSATDVLSLDVTDRPESGCRTLVDQTLLECGLVAPGGLLLPGTSRVAKRTAPANASLRVLLCNEP
jgi:hypothetical protein